MGQAGSSERSGWHAALKGSLNAVYLLAKGMPRRQRHGLWVLLLVMMPVAAWADVAVMREVVVSSKTGPAIGNIAPVNNSCDIEMKEARVDITVGEPQKEREDLVIVETRAVFLMANTSDNELVLTVGFPVSDSAYSAFKRTDFNVTSNEQEKTVFNRITGYPSYVKHRWVSGPKSSPDELPDVADTGDPFGHRHEDLENETGVTEESYKENAPPRRRRPPRTMRSLFSLKAIFPADRSASMDNIMVWREDFSPSKNAPSIFAILWKFPFRKTGL